MVKMFEEFQKHLMEDKNPSLYFDEIINNKDIYTLYPYTLLRNLIETPQSPIHHPEGNVWKHTMLVIDNAAKRKEISENPIAFMWAALLHDLGKAPTTKFRKGKITSYDHDKVGSELSKRFLCALTNDEELIIQVTALVRWHMQTLFVTKDLPFSNVEEMRSDISIKEIALLSLCDRLGRGDMNETKICEEKENIESFIRKCEERSLSSK
ncbi:HDIG domain-containing protein [Clostridium estertheticum]|uniref:HDIG domain-containing metalloprotein n=1 Tax=Clostridium estertheticum TaxID=238834 RepID=UPI001C0C38B4|nr:HDIG domain-containing metalloprotein [Clostridium estertheticum]MBU3215978.1 HDIG domain-containing protein [Clostridium estertheticum]WAG54039.1 HDIG domain-containing protein [Clostridium estertheticum]